MPVGPDSLALPRPRGRASVDLLAVLGVVAVGLALFLPFIGRSWTANEANAGTFYRAFSRVWDEFGFFALKGLEVGTTGVPTLQPGIATGYVNHPPAMAWVIYWAGSAEWQMRLPTVVCVIALGVMLYLWLAPRIGRLAAATAGVATLLPPTMSVHGQTSYELGVAVLGVGMMIAFERYLGARERANQPAEAEATGDGLAPRTRATVWRTGVVVGTCAFLGPWFDWSFLYVYCLGLIPFVVRRRLGPVAQSVRLAWGLWLPAAVATTSLGLLFWWRFVVTNDPDLPDVPDTQVGIVDLYLRTWHEFQQRGVWTSFLGAVRMVREGFTDVLLIAALIGVVPLFRAVPRVACALAFGALHPALFPSHALDHAMFFVYIAPILVLSAGMTVQLVFRWSQRWSSARDGGAGLVPRIVGSIALLLVLGAPGLSATQHLRATSYDFYRDLGRVLSEAADEDRYVVGHGWPYGAYTAYIDALRVFPYSVRDAGLLAQQPSLRRAEGLGVRYLWLRFGDVPAFAREFEEPDGLAELMRQFPRDRVSKLEGRFDVTGRGHVVEVTEAWLVTMSDP